MVQIFKHTYLDKPVILVPEPQNKHDRNAIKVTIAGKKIGYISRDDNLKVKHILSEHKIKLVSALFSGGEYKVVSENGDAVTLENKLSIRVKISYV